MKRFKRLLQLAAMGFTGLLLVTACGSGDGSAGQGDPSTTETISYGSWVPGAPPVSNMWTHFLAEMPEIQEKHGIKFENTDYSSLQTLYTDLSRGRVQAVSAGPSTMAATAAQGAPVRMVGGVARSTAAIMSTGKAWDAQSLKGSRMVAPTGTATWSEVQAQIEDTLGLKPGDYELVTSQDLGGAMTQLAAGSADYAMVWGEYIPNALQKFKNVKIIADPETLAGEGNKPFWQFSVTVHKSVSDEAAAGLMASIEEVVAWMKAHPEEVEDYAVSQKQGKGIALDMIEGRQNFDVTPMDADLKAELDTDFQKLVDMGKMEKMPPASFLE